MRWMKGDIHGFTTVEDDGCQVLVKESFDADNLVSLVEMTEKRRKHALRIRKFERPKGSVQKLSRATDKTAITHLR